MSPSGPGHHFDWVDDKAVFDLDTVVPNKLTLLEIPVSLVLWFAAKLAGAPPINTPHQISDLGLWSTRDMRIGF